MSKENGPRNQPPIKGSSQNQPDTLNRFNDTEMGAELRTLTRKFARNTILPRLEEDEKNRCFRPEWIAEMGKLGLTGVPVPEAFGGVGLGYEEYCVVIEELAAVSASYAISVGVSGLPQVILNLFGNDDQKKKFIPPLAAGEHIGAFSLSEASSGSDAASLRTTATKKGDHYILNGTKLWCTQADSAKCLLVMAKTGEKSISTFVVTPDMPGFSVGKKEEKMGLHASHTCEVLLENVKVPKTHLVGEEGQGFKIAMTALNSGRITIGAVALGVARAAIEVARKHAQEREQFGRPIGEFQGISFLLADMATQLTAARFLVKRAAQLKDSDEAFATEAAMAKCFATDMAMKVTTDAVQILGGSGYTREFPVERYMREAKVLQIVEGTNQIQRLVIGKSILASTNI